MEEAQVETQESTMPKDDAFRGQLIELIKVIVLDMKKQGVI